MSYVGLKYDENKSLMTALRLLNNESVNEAKYRNGRSEDIKEQKCAAVKGMISSSLFQPRVYESECLGLE